MSDDNGPSLRIATLNLRNTSDRWEERAPLLIDQFVALAPDVIGLQEVRVPADQGRWIVDQVNQRLAPERRYEHYFQTNKTGLQGRWEGIAIVSRLPIIAEDRLDLQGGHRVAQRVRVELDGATLDVYNTHLHHEADAHELREAQARLILDWMEPESYLPQVLVGDMNAKPWEPATKLLRSRLRSAYEAVHGREPERTSPAPLSEHWDAVEGHVIDYIFVNELIEVLDARVTFDRVDPHDARLSASDHYGLAADISVRA